MRWWFAEAFASRENEGVLPVRKAAMLYRLGEWPLLAGGFAGRNPYPPIPVSTARESRGLTRIDFVPTNLSNKPE